MKQDLRIATFNLENLAWSAAEPRQFERRVEVLRPILCELQADVLCLQEIAGQKPEPGAPRRLLALDRLVEHTTYANYYRACSTRPGSDAAADVHNLAILSRWPFRATRQIHHDIVPKWRWSPLGRASADDDPVEIAFDRPLLYAAIEFCADATLHIINIHLRAPRPVPLPQSAVSSRTQVEGLFLAAEKRDRQALETRLFVEDLFDQDPDALIAVCGDFNVDEHDTATQLLKADVDGGDRVLAAVETRAASSRCYSVIHGGEPRLIDHILVSLALARRFKDVTILNKDLQDEAFAQDPIEGSLHAPIVAAFESPGKQDGSHGE
jgi:endonuclease/exonuclease/phosphatase family metal-dependent hydrolase